jgi:MbtH protein
MNRHEEEDQTIYKVVVNHEEQYSVWPADKDNPLGWRDAGKSGSKAECLAYIKEVWTDMRPLSLRSRLVEENCPPNQRP